MAFGALERFGQGRFLHWWMYILLGMELYRPADYPVLYIALKGSLRFAAGLVPKISGPHDFSVGRHYIGARTRT